MILNRKISKEIEKWYRKSGKALLIKGARQVGKTYTIRSVLQKLGCSFVEINLIEHPLAIDVLKNSTSIDDLILGLSTFTDKKIIKGQSVIFIDEAQKYKELVTRIKFFVDEGSFKYILSGSLLGVEITNLESAPVGYLTTYEMYPLDFEEFLQVTNVTDEVIQHIKISFENRTPIMDAINEKMMAAFRQYLVVGGMPEAVSEFANNHNINEIAAIHRDIIDQYRLDFTQYEVQDKKLILSNIYDLVPSELLKKNRRFIVTDIKKGLHFQRVESSFLWLYKSGVIIPAYNATEPRVPLKINEKSSLFKLYLSDVGLLTTIYGMNTKAMIIGRDKNLNGGGLYENAVAQELTRKGYKLYYYNSNRLGELDFIIEYSDTVLPVEVKSGKDYKKHSALDNCLSNPEYKMKEAFVFADCNVSKQDKITYLPVYMVGFINNNTEMSMVIDRVLF